MRTRLLVVVTAIVVVAGCRDPNKRKQEQTPPDAAASNEKAEPKVEPESAPSRVAVRLALAPAADPVARTEAAKKVSAFLADKTGFDIVATVAPSNRELLQAMRKGEVQLIHTSGWGYLRAHLAADADLLLVEEWDGAPTHGAAWYRKKGGPKKLSDLAGKRVGFTEPTSAAGFLLPYSALIQAGVLTAEDDPNKLFGSVEFTRTEKAALEALLKGDLDAVASSTAALADLSDDERKSLEVLADLPPAPNDCLAVRSDLGRDVRDKLQNALLELNKPENKETLQALTSAPKLVTRGHWDHVKDVQKAQDLMGSEFPLRLPPDKGAEPGK